VHGTATGGRGIRKFRPTSGQVPAAGEGYPASMDARRYRLSAEARPLRVLTRTMVIAWVVLGLAFLGYCFLVTAPSQGTVGADAYAYWSVQLPHPYSLPVGDLGAFTYSPPMAMLFHLVDEVPWWVFLWLWLAIQLGTAVWLGGRRALLVLAFPPVAMELYYGNVNLLIAAAVLLGFAHPWTWAFVLLTKPTCGVGLLWFAARGEWRRLATALAVTGIIVIGSFVIAPGLWAEWFAFLSDSAAGQPAGAWLAVPVWVRLPAAAALVVWGARTDRRWTVAVSVALALPVIWFAGLAVLAAIVREPRPAGETPRPARQRTGGRLAAAGTAPKVA